MLEYFKQTILRKNNLLCKSFYSSLCNETQTLYVIFANLAPVFENSNKYCEFKNYNILCANYFIVINNIIYHVSTHQFQNVMRSYIKYSIVSVDISRRSIDCVGSVILGVCNIISSIRTSNLYHQREQLIF